LSPGWLINLFAVHIKIEVIGHSLINIKMINPAIKLFEAKIRNFARPYGLHV